MNFSDGPKFNFDFFADLTPPYIIDTMLHSLLPLVQSSSPIFAAWKMYGIQSVINFFIHSGTGQAALTMPIMAPLADLVGVTRQTAILA